MGYTRNNFGSDSYHTRQDVFGSQENKKKNKRSNPFKIKRLKASTTAESFQVCNFIRLKEHVLK